MKKILVKASKKPSSSQQYHMFVGRWQPLHDGHMWLFDQVLNEGKNVLICIRDVEPDNNNPYTAIEVYQNIQKNYEKYIGNGRVKVLIIPDIEAVCFGRGVGYDIIEFEPPKMIGDISATKIREQIGIVPKR